MKHIVSVAIDDDLLKRIEKWRKTLSVPAKKSTAIRALLELALEAEQRKTGGEQ